MTNATDLFAAVNAGQMITRKSPNGADNSLYLQGGQYVMVKQGSHNTHSLAADCTSAERLFAHWNGFCGVAEPREQRVIPERTAAQREADRVAAHNAKVAELLGPSATWVTVAEACRLEAAECKRQAQRVHRGFLRSREAMALATDSKGRVGDPLDYSLPGRITGKWIREAAKEAPRAASGLSIEGGVDWFESFRDMLDGCDYEPSVEVWAVDVPAHLFGKGG